MKTKKLSFVALMLVFATGLSADYQGYSGQRYKYDLNNPSDRMNYNVDVGAKFNDKFESKYNYDVKMDRQMGQYGGGIQPKPIGIEPIKPFKF